MTGSGQDQLRVELSRLPLDDDQRSIVSIASIDQGAAAVAADDVRAALATLERVCDEEAGGDAPPLALRHLFVGDGARTGIDLFLGMIYASLISFLINRAGEARLFDSLGSSFFLFVLLAYIAQDWVSRTVGNQRVRHFTMRARMSPFSRALKFVLDLMLAFILLLISVRLLPLASVDIASYRNITARDPALWWLAALYCFANCAWNWVVIFHSGLVTLVDIKQLVGLCVPSKLIAVYPHLHHWQRCLEEEFRKIEASTSSDWGPFREAVVLWKALRVMATHAVGSAMGILAPYALIYHMLILYAVLGVFFLVAAMGPEVSPEVQAQKLFCLIPSVALLFAALVSYVFHLAPQPRLPPALERSLERFAALCLLFSVIFFYLALPTYLLLAVVVMQQLSANWAVLAYFRPVDGFDPSW